MFTRHWSQNKSGFCRLSATCSQVHGTLEHILVSCPALSKTRESMYQMWLERSVMYPSMHAVIRSVLSSEPADIVQFVLEPLSLPILLEDYITHGDNFIRQLSYMTRTFAFYMQRQYKQLQSQHYSTPPTNASNLGINSSVSGRRGWSSDCQSTPLGSQYFHPSDDTMASAQYSLCSTSHAVTSSGIDSVSYIGGQDCDT